MRYKNPLLTGTLILTSAGFITRILGFFYRIYLSDLIGAEGMGLYQLIFPVFGVCFSFCCGPVQTSVSRYVASSVSRETDCRRFFHAGFLISFSLSLLSCLLLYVFSPWIARRILLEDRCAPMLKVMALTIPVNAVHCSICGYYYGKKKASIPAFSQLAEQLIRVFSVYLAAQVTLASGREVTPFIAVAGLFAGEAGAMLFTAAAYSITRFRPIAAPAASAGYSLSLSQACISILKMAVPLAANRLILSGLQSVEAVMIPGRLQMYGMTSSQALAVYGTLNGMAMHFILFPSALTNSIAVMLLPDVAEAQSLNHVRKISRNASASLRFCLSVGILCTGIFIFHGMEMGILFFKNETAGLFIQNLAWLCPFLYIATTMGSILNGMGKTSLTFTHNLISLIIQLAFVIFGIPIFGITACLFGMLVSEVALCFLHLTAVRRYAEVSFRPLPHLARPLCAFFLAHWAAKTAGSALFGPSGLSSAAGLVFTTGLTALIYILLLAVTEEDGEGGFKSRVSLQNTGQI